MQNVLKANASVRMDLNHKDQFALILMNVDQTWAYVENILHALIHPDRLDVNVQREYCLK